MTKKLLFLNYIYTNLKKKNMAKTLTGKVMESSCNWGRARDRTIRSQFFLLTEFCIVSYVLVDKENPNGVFLVFLLIKHMKWIFQQISIILWPQQQLHVVV